MVYLVCQHFTDDVDNNNNTIADGSFLLLLSVIQQSIGNILVTLAATDGDFWLSFYSEQHFLLPWCSPKSPTTFFDLKSIFYNTEPTFCDQRWCCDDTCTALLPPWDCFGMIREGFDSFFAYWTLLLLKIFRRWYDDFTNRATAIRTCEHPRHVGCYYQ